MILILKSVFASVYPLPMCYSYSYFKTTSENRTYLFIWIYSCVCGPMHVPELRWELVAFISLLYYVCPGYQIQVVRLGGKSLFLLSQYLFKKTKQNKKPHLIRARLLYITPNVIFFISPYFFMRIILKPFFSHFIDLCLFWPSTWIH